MCRQCKTGRSSCYTRVLLSFKGPLTNWRTGPMGIPWSSTKGGTKSCIWGRISSQALVFCVKLWAAQQWYKYFHFFCLCSICSVDQCATTFYFAEGQVPLIAETQLLVKGSGKFHGTWRGELQKRIMVGRKEDNDIVLVVPKLRGITYSRSVTPELWEKHFLRVAMRELIQWSDAKGYKAFFTSLLRWIDWKIHLTNLGGS